MENTNFDCFCTLNLPVAMKNPAVLLLMLFSLFAGGALTAQDRDSILLPAPVVTKRALLFAIGDYPTSTSGWTKIHAATDAAALTTGLLKQGFARENITLVSDSQATFQGMLDAFHAFGLTVNPGDHLLVHFSGHGQQIADQNGDEADGYDEALIPWDAGKYYIKGQYEGERHLRDDTLQVLLSMLQHKAGPTGSVLVLVDACHSGTATRGQGIVRGSDTPFNNSAEMRSSPSSEDTELGFVPSGTETAPLTVISASAAGQNNYEYSLPDGTSMGSLTWAFCRALEQAEGDRLCRQVYQQIRHSFASAHPWQQPQAEGSLDAQLFGGLIPEPVIGYSVTGTTADSLIIVEAGSLHGLSEGSRVAFFVPNLINPLENITLAEGTVVAAAPFIAMVMPDSGTVMPADSLPLTLCMSTRKSYDGMGAGLYSENLPEALDTLLSGLPGQHPFIRFEETPAAAIARFDSLTGTLYLMTAPGTILLTMPDALKIKPEILRNAVTERLWMYARALFLRGYEEHTDQAGILLEISDNRGYPVSLPADESLQVVHQGDTLRVKITNTGENPFWFNLLDIQPDNYVNILIPGPMAPRHSMNDLYLEPGNSYLSGPLIVEPPAGTEMFTCIATPYPLDLRDAFKPGLPAQHRDSGNDPLSLQIFTMAGNKSATRGARNLENTTACTQQLLFQIAP